MVVILEMSITSSQNWDTKTASSSGSRFNFNSYSLHLRQISPDKIIHPQATHSAFDYTGQGVVYQVSRNAQGLGQQFVNPAQKRAAATQGYATVDDVSDQFGRGLLQHAASGLDDVLERVLQRFDDLTCSQCDRARQACRQLRVR